MKFQGEVATDGACFYALYAPSLLRADLGDEFDDNWSDYCLDMPDTGRMFRYQEGGDGSPVVHVFVDEQPEDELVAMMQGEITGSLLRVPTGRLILAAGEDLPALAKDNHEHRPLERHPLCEGDWSVPPGNYELWAFNMDSDLKGDAVLNQLTAIQRASVTAVDGMLYLFATLGCASVLAGVFAMIAVIASGSETAKWIAIGSGLGIVLTIGLSIALTSIPPFGTAWKRRDQLRSAIPDIVVVLTRIPDGQLPDAYEPASLLYDDGLRYSERAKKYEKMTRGEQAIERNAASARNDHR